MIKKGDLVIVDWHIHGAKVLKVTGSTALVKYHCARSGKVIRNVSIKSLEKVR